MENGDFLTVISQVFVHYGALMLLGVVIIGAAAAFWLYRQQSERQHDVQKEMQALRFELDEHRMNPRRPGQAPKQGPAPARTVNRVQADLELQAYQKIWASIRDLHDKLGSFLRAIETGESSSETRLAARTAALKAKDCAQRLRPFYPENIEALVFQLIDNEVHMHLSACAYLDGSPNDKNELAGKSSRDETSSAYQALRDECKLIYDGECRQQLNLLVQAIRSRLSGQEVIE